MQAGQHAGQAAKALLILNQAGLLEDKNRNAVIEVAQYSDLIVEKLLSCHRDKNLTDENRETAVQAIKEQKEKAKNILSELKKSIDDQYTDIALLADFAKKCIELKPFSREFLSHLGDEDRNNFIRKLLEKIASSTDNEKDYYTNLFKDVVKIDPTLLNQMNSRGFSPLDYTIAKLEDFDTTKLLIECGANPHQTWWGFNAMTLAQLNKKESNPSFLKQLKTITALNNSNTYNTFEEWHSQMNLIFLGRTLGYQTNKRGICVGYASMGMQAFLLSSNDEKKSALDTFSQRISSIHTVSPEKHLVNLKSAREKIREKGSIQLANLSEDEEISHELPAFYEGIELLQQSTDYKELYENKESPQYQSPESALPLTASKELEKQGGVVSLNKFSGVYSDDELIQYFNELKNSASESNTRVGLMLASHSHGIFVGYDPINGQFTLIDANQSKSSPILMFNLNDIPQAVKKAFLSKDEKIIMETSVFSAQKNQEIVSKQCGRWLTKIKNIHVVTPEKVDFRQTRKPTESWEMHAISSGEKDLLKEIQKNKINRSSFFGKIIHTFIDKEAQDMVDQVQIERKIKK